MTKSDIDEIIEGMAATIPARLTGNEENSIIAERLRSLVQSDREAVVELMRDWLSVRVRNTDNDPEYGRKVGAMSLALEVVEKYSLKELHSDIEALIADVRSGKTFLPYYADMIAKYLKGTK